MPYLSDGARQLPLRHLSIRVPWNDTDWTGCICKKPADNVSCLILRRIREQRRDENESKLSGKKWSEIDEEQLPPCVSERGSFMSPRELTRILSHPYSKTSDAHKHLLPTPFRYPPYSAACLPFSWMLKEFAAEKYTGLELGFEPEREDRAHDVMGFKTVWVQTKHNQLVMLDTFFSAIQPQKSLCFIYAKRIPLVEESRRVIIGVGWVEHVGEKAVEYRYSEKGKINPVLWERPVQHSIRPNFKNGFLLPYHEVIEYLNNHPEEDPSQYVAFAPDEHFWSFSYASEHVTNDGAIASLLSCNKALQSIEKVVDGPWTPVGKWIDERLNELWNMRGPVPGLGSALRAFGVEHGNLLAFEIEKLLSDSHEDPWEVTDKILRNPKKHPKDISRLVTPTISRKWESLSPARQNLLKLLSRFELTNDQSACYYVNEDKRRQEFRINVTDTQLIENPYLLYEIDRLTPDPISMPVIDRGVFPDNVIREKFPLPSPSKVEDPLDERRVRAFAIRQLESAAVMGHTLLPREDIIRQIRDADAQPQCPVDGDMMALAEKIFQPEIIKVEMADGGAAYQLKRLGDVGALIRESIKKRLKGKRHQANINWPERLDNLFGEPSTDDAEQELEARREKAEALEELFSARVSVLIGPAGTGKTTLLKLLCDEESVKVGGVLALAPTGKARVRMEQQTGLTGAKTIAQFLVPIDRYEPKTGIYRLSDRSPENVAKTVIVDEASMLTEEQLAAVLDALAGVERLILVGDPRQLPPIGAGRPFLDIVEYIQPEDIEGRFPRVSTGYAELTVRRRQVGQLRGDLMLADWFSGRPVDAGADEIWSKITEDEVTDHLRFIPWKSSEDLQKKLLQAIVKELKLENESDVLGFEQSLGGSLFKGGVYFHSGWKDRDGACKKIEDWQILSPVRNAPHGVESLNRFIQGTFRQKTKDWANQRWRKIPKPMGREEIVYGDKVINLKNHYRKDVYPKDEALCYVANGEIGVVVGQYKRKNSNMKGLPWKLEVEFASQPRFKYGYSNWDFGEEAEPKLELAYALTVHKVQGSEFGLTFLVVPNPCWLLSRELLYTALTRQQNRVIIFHQGNPHELKRFATDYHSEAARRLTNLFEAPSRVELQDRFLEERLIHRTRRGESVRSKSEVIIADLLYSKKVQYSYEAPLVGKDGKTRYPDFFFADDESGLKVYWEHLGMLHIPEYRDRWEKKLQWYKEQGIVLHNEGGGPEGTLITSEDDERGGIHSNEIEKMLDEVLQG